VRAYPPRVMSIHICQTDAYVYIELAGW